MGKQTIKFGYTVESENDRKFISDFIRQYNSCLHLAYNRMFDEEYASLSKMKRVNAISKILKDYSNVELIGSKWREYATNDASAIKERFGEKKICFGSRLNLQRRARKDNPISKDEFRKNRLNPITAQGQSNNYGNSFFRINEDLTITFKPNAKTHINLKLTGSNSLKGNKLRGTWKLLKKLSELQKSKNCRTPIAFKMDFNYIYITFDNTLYGSFSPIRITNRTFSIDMNPNYIGWTVNDWNDNGENTLRANGTFSLEKLNSRDKFIKGKSGKSTMKDKRHYEISVIAKKLVEIASHYRANLICYEKLDFDAKGSTNTAFNRLVRRNWCRESFINTFIKWANIYGYDTKRQIHEVVASYSSIIGNVIYGEKYNKAIPDPECASIEIGRRGYEFHRQFILKNKDKANIVFPVGDKVAEVGTRALEANGIHAKFQDWKTMKKMFDSKKSELHGQKNTKDLYRVPFSSDTKWFKSSSKMSYILRK